MNKIGILISLFFLALTGCTHLNNISAGYALNSDSEKGVLLASVTYQGSFSGYAIKFREIGSKKWNSFQVGGGNAFLLPGMLDWDIESPKLRGNVFAIELPKGEYEFASWLVSSGMISFGPANPFSIRFNIAPGHATYTGNFNFIRTSGFGGTVTAVNVNYANEFDRDIQLIIKKYPRLDTSLTHNNSEQAQGDYTLGEGSTALEIPALIVY